MDKIIVRGAREHNLKNVDVEIPRDKMVVITGVSGSGKSSLAFDTIYAEGQRRYVESLSAYARQFLEQMGKPDLDSIEGLSPAISIEQKTTSKNPRSTVGTVTEIYDYLRLLYARVGVPYCYQCGKKISSQTVQQMVDAVLSMPEGTKFSVLAPIIRGRKGEYKKEFLELRKEGFTRVNVDGEVRELADDIVLDKKKKHDIEVYVDRLVLKEGIKNRLTDSIELSLKLADGLVKIEVQGGEPKLFSERFACIDCGVSYPEITPRMFSFNNPHGACGTCLGLGSLLYFDPALIIPDGTKLAEESIAPWQSQFSTYYRQMVRQVIKSVGGNPKSTWNDLSEKVQDVVLRGGEETVEFLLQKDSKSYKFAKEWEGVIPTLERRMKETESEGVREELSQYQSERMCPDCKGARLKPEGLAIRVGDLSIDKVSNFTIRDGRKFFMGLQLSAKEKEIAQRILKEIHERLGFLESVGLEYLSLSRTSGTLSGGESQRIRLATQIGSSLMGVLYILDEPSIGLHQRDNDRLLATLKRLRDLGNTILVVEHDEDTIRAADYIIDMGPGAGRHGGTVVAAGTPEEVAKNEKSLTGQHLKGTLAVEVPKKRRKPLDKAIVLKGARENNLQKVTAKFPMGVLTCVTGVSGSGKSTLVNDTLLKALNQHFNQSKEKPGAFDSIEGLEHIDKVIDIDQSPIGRTPRSNPATYTGLFGPIRDLFASLPDSKARGYEPGRYSFNVKGGRCEACQGDGILQIEMHFLPDVFVECETCRGKRYNRETLEIKYKGKNISEVLNMTVDEGIDFFSAIKAIRSKLETLSAVGLGYIQLGQAATTLSGGEAQRIKLSRELSKRPTGRTLYLLDEPTTGLHIADIQKLLEVLGRLVDQGNTVIVIEHNLDVIKVADHVIDLGPEGGDRGGKIIAEGTPEQIAKVTHSYTGHFLARVLAPKPVAPKSEPAKAEPTKAEPTRLEATKTESAKNGELKPASARQPTK
jgi:excinuclease ABC subunit A